MVRRRVCRRQYLSHAESLTEVSSVEDLSASVRNKNLNELTPAPRILPVMRSTPSPEKVQAQHGEEHMVDLYAVATDSFQSHLDWIEKQGPKDSPDWQLVNGLLRLAQGLRQDHVEEEERRKSFARS
jgi:hypothetical protein